MIAQCARIFVICLVGECLHAWLPLPIPSGVYGFGVMLLALSSGLIKLPQVEKAADFFVSLLPLIFVPALVGLLNTSPMSPGILWPIALLIFLSTLLVMAVSGRLTQALLKRKEAKK